MVFSQISTLKKDTTEIRSVSFIQNSFLEYDPGRYNKRSFPVKLDQGAGQQPEYSVNL